MIHTEPNWKSYLVETTEPIFTPEQCESMYGTEKELLHKTLNEIKQLEESNNLFNFYAKEE